MIKSLRVAVIICLVLSIGQSILAQEKIIEQSEFDQVQNKADKLREGKAYRLKILSATFENNGSQLKEKSTYIYETLPPDRSYSSSIDEAGKIKTKIEYITIGEREFVRKNDGKWEKYQPEGGSGFGAGREKRVVKFIGTEKLGDKTADVYQLTEIFYGLFSAEETTKYWFDQKGYLLKESYKGKSLDKDLIRTRDSTYDYDAKIKIEAPIK